MSISLSRAAALLGGTVLLAALLPATAQAGDVSWSISVGTPGYHYAPPPVVYVQPQPVYVAPQRVYVPPPVHVQPGIVVHAASPRFGYGPPPHARGHRHGHHHHKHRHHGHHPHRR